jgi:hypothetical protein
MAEWVNSFIKDGDLESFAQSNSFIKDGDLESFAQSNPHTSKLEMWVYLLERPKHDRL